MKIGGIFWRHCKCAPYFGQYLVFHRPWGALSALSTRIVLIRYALRIYNREATKITPESQLNPMTGKKR